MIADIRAAYVQAGAFSGRATRAEFWWFAGFQILVAIVADVISAAGLPVIAWPYALFAVVSFVPAVAVTVRRLHDINRSGWWALIALLLVIGTLGLVALLALPGTPGQNAYGNEHV